MITLKVTGMNCRHCMRAVEDALRGVPGVTRVERVELGSSRAGYWSRVMRIPRPW